MRGLPFYVKREAFARADTRQRVAYILSAVLVITMLCVIFRFSAADATHSSHLSEGVCIRLVRELNSVFPEQFPKEKLVKVAEAIEYPIRKCAHLRGGCPICTQTYVQGMIADGMKCMNRAKGIYGEDNEFVNYTDLGDYPSENLERPGFRRLMKDIEEDNLDVIVVITLDKITTDIDLLMETYQTIRKHNIQLITANDGKKAMEILDKALVKWQENSN